jgi:hypothetical protein
LWPSLGWNTSVASKGARRAFAAARSG